MIARVLARGFTSTQTFRVALLLTLLTTVLLIHAPAAYATPGESWTQVFDGWIQPIARGAELNGRLWMIDRNQKVWSSEDGQNWTKALDLPPWNAREFCILVATKTKLWLLGGTEGVSEGSVPATGIWSSVDGVSWTRAGTVPLEILSSCSQCIAHADRLWMFGTPDGSGNVWSSADGAVWTKSPSSAPWKGHDVLASASNGTTMCVADYDSANSKTNIWSSPDGLTWSLLSTPAWGDHARRDQPGFVFCNGRWWITGGDGGPQVSDAWNSADGITWTKVAGPPNLKIAGSRCISYHDRIWLFGKCLWSSEDGVSWDFVGPPCQGEEAVHGGELWMLSNVEDWGVHVTSLWHTKDGMQWAKVPQPTPWNGRSPDAMVDFGGKIWVLGGYTGNESARDVWCTADGASWQRTTSQAPWAPRQDSCAVAFRGKLWVLGGYGSGAVHNDVWSSMDGKDWTQVAQTARWDARDRFCAVAFRDRIWVFGGATATDVRNDVWSSANGQDWELVTKNAPWASRLNFSVTATDGKLWLCGGTLGDGRGTTGTDLWSSDDGQT